MKIKKSQKMKRRSALGMKGEIVMAFKFEKDKFYMQPVFFGPTTTMGNPKFLGVYGFQHTFLGD